MTEDTSGKVTYKFIDPESSPALFQVMSDVSKIDLFKTAFEQKWVIKGLFPPLFPSSFYNFQQKWKTLGDRKGNAFLKTALKQLAELGEGDGILLDKVIEVVREDGSKVGLIPSFLTEPKNAKWFITQDLGYQWFVSLKKRPASIERMVGPLDGSSLIEYHKRTPAHGSVDHIKGLKVNFFIETGLLSL